MKRCPNCDSKDLDEDLAEEGFCSECGEELESEDDHTDKDEGED